MKKSTFNYSLFHGALVLALVVGFSSCKNKKKMSEVSDQQQVSQQIQQELEEDDTPEQPERVAVKEPTKSQKLENYFASIATSGSVAAANGTIGEALTMFSNPDAPVLIVIYRADGSTDYDEPTTIKKYLEYIKDTKNNRAAVEEMVMDDYGKIKELVLKKI